MCTLDVVRQRGIGMIQRRSRRGAPATPLSDRLTKLPFKDVLVRGFTTRLDLPALATARERTSSEPSGGVGGAGLRRGGSRWGQSGAVDGATACGPWFRADRGVRGW